MLNAASSGDLLGVTVQVKLNMMGKSRDGMFGEWEEKSLGGVGQESE